MEVMRNGCEKRIVLHDKNVEQSTAGQYRHFVIDIRLQETTGNRGYYNYSKEQSQIAELTLIQQAISWKSAHDLL